MAVHFSLRRHYPEQVFGYNLSRKRLQHPRKFSLAVAKVNYFLAVILKRRENRTFITQL
jgi:hypothetical protein